MKICPWNSVDFLTRCRLHIELAVSCLQTLSQNIRRRTGCGRSRLVQLLQHQTLRHSWSRATCLSRRDSDKERVKGARSGFGRGIGWRMPAFCLGCLGCLKCFIPSFVPMLGSFVVSFFMVGYLLMTMNINDCDKKIIIVWLNLFPQDLPTPVIALVVALACFLPFLPSLRSSSSTTTSKPVEKTAEKTEKTEWTSFKWPPSHNKYLQI